MKTTEEIKQWILNCIQVTLIDNGEMVARRWTWKGDQLVLIGNQERGDNVWDKHYDNKKTCWISYGNEVTERIKDNWTIQPLV